MTYLAVDRFAGPRRFRLVMLADAPSAGKHHPTRGTPERVNLKAAICGPLAGRRRTAYCQSRNHYFKLAGYPSANSGDGVAVLESGRVGASDLGSAGLQTGCRGGVHARTCSEPLRTIGAPRIPDCRRSEGRETLRTARRGGRYGF